MTLKIYNSLLLDSLTIGDTNFPSEDGNNGEFLKTDGAGNLTFSPVPSNIVTPTPPVVDNNLIAFDGTTGTVLKDAGVSPQNITDNSDEIVRLDDKNFSVTADTAYLLPENNWITPNTRLTVYSDIGSLIYFAANDNLPVTMTLFIKDESSIAPRFRITFAGSGIGGSAFSQLYNFAAIDGLTYLTTGSKIVASITFLEWVAVFVVNGVVVDTVPLGPEIQAGFPFKVVLSDSPSADYKSRLFIEKFKPLN